MLGELFWKVFMKREWSLENLQDSKKNKVRLPQTRLVILNHQVSRTPVNQFILTSKTCPYFDQIFISPTYFKMNVHKNFHLRDHLKKLCLTEQELLMKKIIRNFIMAKFYYGGLKTKMLFVSLIFRSLSRDLGKKIVI